MPTEQESFNREQLVKWGCGTRKANPDDDGNAGLRPGAPDLRRRYRSGAAVFALRCAPSEDWRRERDSNPRCPFGACTLSRRVPSATRPSLHQTRTVYGHTAIFNSKLGGDRFGISGGARVLASPVLRTKSSLGSTESRPTTVYLWRLAQTSFSRHHLTP
jgi:hypothetical protein